MSLPEMPIVQKPATIEQMQNKPGFIRVAHQRGSFFGCAIRDFVTLDEANSFFDVGNRWVVIQVDALPGGGVRVLYTSEVSQEELNEFTECYQEAERIVAERKAKRAEAEAALACNAEVEAAEQKRLAEVGRKCEANHGKLAKALRKGK